MSASFDPYHKWLGIGPKDQPPNHYRLLGLENFESDLQVIEAAADRQLGFLRRYQSGEHATSCQKLLNEVSRARLCLLKPAFKAEYDAELRQKLGGGVDFPDMEFVDELPTAAGALQSKVKKSRPPAGTLTVGGIRIPLPAAIGGGALVVLMAVIAIVSGARGKPPAAPITPAQSPATNPGNNPAEIAAQLPEKSQTVTSPEPPTVAKSDGSDEVKAKFFGQEKRQRNSTDKSSPSRVLKEAVNDLPLMKESKQSVGNRRIGPDKLESSGLKPGQSVDLLPLVNLPTDVGSGTVTREGTALHTGTNGYCQFQIPFALPPEYSLEVDLESNQKTQPACVIFPFQSGQGTTVWGNNKGDTNILVVDGVTYINYRLPQYPRDRFLDRPNVAAQRTLLRYFVRRNHLQVFSRDELLFDWRGDTRRFVPVPEFPSTGNGLALASHGAEYKFHAVKLTRLSESKSPFKLPSQPINGDLLRLVDPERDTVSGYWTKSGRRLTSTPELPNAIRFPAKLPADYEFRLVVERKSEGELLEVSLPIQGQRMILAIDGYRGTGGGVELPDGKRYDHNPLFFKYDGYQLPQGEPAIIKGRVQGRHLAVEINGKTFIEQDLPDVPLANSEVVRPQWLTADEQLQLGLMTDSIFDVYEVRYRPLTGDSADFPRLNLANLKSTATAKQPAESPPSATGILISGAVPRPDAAALQAATSKIRELYSDDISRAKKDSEKLALASKLEVLSKESQDDPAVKYASLELAQALVMDVGDVVRAFAIVEMLSSEFNVDPWELRSSLVKELAPKVKGPLLNKELLDKVLPLVDGLMSAERFSLAVEITAVVSQVAVKAKDKAVQADAAELKKEAEVLAQEFAIADAARKLLASKPDDAHAKLTWGRWLCLRKGNWDEGLPLLVAGDDPQLQGLAKRELQVPAGQAEMVQLSNDWLTFAKSKKDHVEAQFADRAMYWLQQAIDQSSGLEKTRNERLLAEALEVRDWDSLLLALLEQVEKKVAQGRYQKSTYTTRRSGDPFESVSNPPGILIGLNCAVRIRDDSASVKAIQPVYFTKIGERSGGWYGSPDGAQQVVEVRARSGYAINGFASQVNNGCDNIQISFGRVMRLGLDVGRTYHSPLIGLQIKKPEAPSLAMSGNQPIIGMFGNADNWLQGFGVIFTK